MRLSSIVVIWISTAGCAADAAPYEAELIVENAGALAPVTQAERCTLAIRPAARAGVNCRVDLRCGDEDLFGGRRIGGYADCDTRDGLFTAAVDPDPRDGDPAIHANLRTGALAWWGARKTEIATFRIP